MSGGEGTIATRFIRKAVLFSNSSCKTHHCINVPRTFVLSLSLKELTADSAVTVC